MANISSGIYAVGGHTISVDALNRFSTFLPSPASSLVEQGRGVITALQNIPANRDEVDRFRDCLLKCLLVVLSAVYEHTIGEEDPPVIPSDILRDLHYIATILDKMEKKLTGTDSVATSQHKRLRVKKDFIATPRTSLLEDLTNTLLQAIKHFDVEANFNHAARLCNISRITQKFDYGPLLAMLPQAKYARFDCERPDRPAGCLKGTRTGIIKDTILWIIDPASDAKRFFWLKGLAGTGKTTIAHTIAKLAQSLGILGASFFFSRRGEAELRNPALVFPTIAHQLALLDPTFCNLITAALKADPQAPSTSLGQQLDRLIIKPLSQLKPDLDRVAVIVFDAFDECENVGARTVLQALVNAIPSFPFFLKIFVTSRPESHIRSVLIPSNKNLQITALHEIQASVVQQDILRYLRDGIRKLPSKKGLTLPVDWITEVEIELLARAAGELFIYAATMLRALEEAYSLRRQLDVLLRLATAPHGEHERSNPFVYLDRLYTEVLRGPITPSNEAQALELLQLLLGTIVLLRDPIPVDALERLTGMGNGEALDTLSSLYSVILPPAPPDNCPRTYHPSFSDFLQNPKRCTDAGLYIDTSKHETRMANRCLTLLNAHLHKGIIGELDPLLLNSEVRGLKERVGRAFPPELQYACRHWAHHLAKVPHGNADVNEALDKFVSETMLPWMESISWLEYAIPGVKCLEIARFWAANPATSEETARLLDDGYRLLLAHNPNVDLSAQHLWQSVLPFIPSGVALTSKYSNFANACIKVAQGVDSHWPSSHKAPVDPSRVITLSPDGTWLASASDDNAVRLWNTSTGACTKTFVGHSQRITSLAFSPSATHLASGSCDGTARLWDLTSGICTATFTDNSNTVWAVAFSRDGSRLASGSGCTVCLWNTTTNVCTNRFTCHSHLVTSIAFSPEDTDLLCGSWDKNVRIWDISTGVCTSSIHLSPPRSTAPQSRLNPELHQGWDDARIEDPAEGVRTGRGSTWVTSIAFSPDGTLIEARSSTDIRLFWKPSEGVPVSEEEWNTTVDRCDPHRTTFTHQDGRLYGARGNKPKRLICFLPPGTDAKHIVSCRLGEDVEVVAITCRVPGVIILQVKLESGLFDIPEASSDNSLESPVSPSSLSGWSTDEASPSPDSYSHSLRFLSQEGKPGVPYLNVYA